MQLLTIASFFYLQEQINRVIFKVFNQTRQILYLEYLKKSIQLISIIIGIYYLNMQILMIGFVITNIIGYFINYYFSRKIIGSVSSFEILTLFKVSTLSVLIVIIIIQLTALFNLQHYMIFLTIPILFFLYLIGLYLLNIINIRKEIKYFTKLYS